MKCTDLRMMVLPTLVRSVVTRLQAAIEVADTNQGMVMAAQRAEGFVLGLETAGAFQSDVIEALYVGFENAVAIRRDELRDLL